MTPREVCRQIQRITTLLVECSLCDAQNFPSFKNIGGHTLISIPNGRNLSLAINGDTDYFEIYQHLNEAQAFNVRMLDGGIIQFLYDFDGNSLWAHRLAYFPSPTLEAFQNDPELYENDEIYADILKRNIVPFPIRFDYSADPAKYVDVSHPKSHLTLGQYKNCRIPVSSPISPNLFIKFILQNFYNTAFKSYENKIPVPSTSFADCISKNERCIPHLVLGQAAA